MKTLTLILILSAAVAPALHAATSVATPSTATTNPAPETAASTDKEKGERRAHMESIFKQLDLTEDQKAKIKEIRKTVTDPKERREQIKAVLTPEQVAKWKELREKEKADKQKK